MLATANETRLTDHAPNLFVVATSKGRHIGDNGVQTSELFRHVDHEGFHGLAVSHVHSRSVGLDTVGLLQMLDGLFHFLLLARADCHINSFGRESLGNTAPNALGPARNDGLEPVETKINLGAFPSRQKRDSACSFRGRRSLAHLWRARARRTFFAGHCEFSKSE